MVHQSWWFRQAKLSPPPYHAYTLIVIQCNLDRLAIIAERTRIGSRRNLEVRYGERMVAGGVSRGVGVG